MMDAGTSTDTADKHLQAIEAAISALPEGAGITTEAMQAAIKAYLKSMRVVLCEREPIAYLKMSTTTWITGETVPAAVMSDEEHHSAFPVYRGIND